MKRVTLIFALVLLVVASFFVVSYAALGDCETTQCIDALNKIPKLFCPGCPNPIVVNDSGYCLHGICNFDVIIYCCSDEPIWQTLICVGNCPI